MFVMVFILLSLLQAPLAEPPQGPFVYRSALYQTDANTNGTIRLSVLLPSGQVSGLGSLSTRIVSIEDEAVLGPSCETVVLAFSIASWTLRSTLRQGVPAAEMTAKWGIDNACNISLVGIIPDSPGTLRIGNFSIPLDPQVIKVSIELSCPWRKQFNRTGDPDAFLAGRRARVLIKLANRISLGHVAALPEVSSAPGAIEGFESFTQRLCTNRMVIPGKDFSPLLPPAFPATQEGISAPENIAKIKFFASNINASASFNAWSLADDNYITVAYANFLATGFNFETVGITDPELIDGIAFVNLTVIFADSVNYDPNFSILIARDMIALSPNSTSDSTAIDSAATQVVAGVVTGVVIVVAIAAAIVWKWRHNAMLAKERQRAHKVLGELSGNTTTNSSRTTASAATHPTQDSPMTRSGSKSNWRQARPSTGEVM